MNENILMIQLRDCFTAGYTLPQFCAENNIKKPLFVAIDERRIDFMWEIYVQFKYDKRITPTFTLLNKKSMSINFTTLNILPDLIFENPDDVDLNKYDKIFVLNTTRLNFNISNLIYLEQLAIYFFIRTYAEIPLLHFLQRHPRVKTIVTSFPDQPQINDPEFQKKFYSLNELRTTLSNDPNSNVKNLFNDLGYTNKEAAILMSVPLLKTNLDGSTYMEDDPNPLVRLKNNQRMTAGQPDNFVNKIYIVGTCHQYGINAPYDKTIASYLQKFLNENNLHYRVENLSQRYFNRQQDMFYNLVKLAPKPDDIIFIHIAGVRINSLPFFDLSHAFEGYDLRDIWVIKGHVNEVGYKILAEKYFQLLIQNNFFKNTKFEYPAPPPPVPHRYGIPRENSSPATNLFGLEELEEHKQKLREKRLKIGCLTINANPFHLGHEYLVQYAASRVHKLFILVDSEDKSEFPFEYRFELVKRGTAQFPNVEVLPSGKFFASMATFSGYFNKENLQDVYVDSTNNAEMFAAEIAPSLGVTIKFDGEEPRDNVTRQYHDNLRTLLPRYGIEYCEIPRREINGEVISAKTVRAALKAGDFDKVKKLVPATTYNFLREKFK